MLKRCFWDLILQIVKRGAWFPCNGSVSNMPLKTWIFCWMQNAKVGEFVRSRSRSVSIGDAVLSSVCVVQCAGKYFDLEIYKHCHIRDRTKGTYTSQLIEKNMELAKICTKTWIFKGKYDELRTTLNWHQDE